MLPLFFLSCLPSALGHGGVVWPPTWQDGAHVPLEEVNSKYTTPELQDPSSGKMIKSVASWLTDQAYIGGHGTAEFRGGEGEVTNFEEGDCNKKCQRNKVPWASPGVAPAFGGGCGVFGGNPYGCYYARYDKATHSEVTVSETHNDTRKAGSPCLSGGTSTYGSDARKVEFPGAATTEWQLGSVQEVAWISTGWHQGGYTYRLCKLKKKGRKKGRKGLTEECFQKNILEFATDYTMVRNRRKVGEWQKYEQKDVSVGTHPEGSVWRPVGFYDGNTNIRKDEVKVPQDLEEGEYVLSWRWDGATKDGQVWLSCSNVRLVR